MGYDGLMYVHLATVVPCFFLGSALLLMTKGTPMHRQLGKIYMVLMLFTAIITVFMPARVGPTLFGHFGWIHSFSLLTIYTVQHILPSGEEMSKHIRVRCFYSILAPW